MIQINNVFHTKLVRNSLFQVHFQYFCFLYVELYHFHLIFDYDLILDLLIIHPKIEITEIIFFFNQSKHNSVMNDPGWFFCHFHWYDSVRNGWYNWIVLKISTSYDNFEQTVIENHLVDHLAHCTEYFFIWKFVYADGFTQPYHNYFSKPHKLKIWISSHKYPQKNYALNSERDKLKNSPKLS